MANLYAIYCSIFCNACCSKWFVTAPPIGCCYICDLHASHFYTRVNLTREPSWHASHLKKHASHFYTRAKLTRKPFNEARESFLHARYPRVIDCLAPSYDPSFVLASVSEFISTAAARASLSWRPTWWWCLVILFLHSYFWHLITMIWAASLETQQCDICVKYRPGYSCAAHAVWYESVGPD